ncbi:hypothetical protein BGZ58_008302 [Dissophora ornata]|nr:hypothetical protein BGZ58_008302 [Dissophora ornata]
MDAVGQKEELMPTDDFLDVFKTMPPKKSIHIIIERRKALKRDGEEALSRKKIRLDMNSLMDAIEEAGLTQKAVVDNKSDLSLCAWFPWSPG